MQLIQQSRLALGILGSPADHPPMPCLGNCQPLPVAIGVVKRVEGRSPVVHKDAAGYETIGFGHLIRPDEKIPELLLGEAVERLLQQDVTSKVAAADARVSVPLFQGQFDAVVSWACNLGEAALQVSTMLKKINTARHNRDWSAAGR